MPVFIIMLLLGENSFIKIILVTNVTNKILDCFECTMCILVPAMLLYIIYVNHFLTLFNYLYFNIFSSLQINTNGFSILAKSMNTAIINLHKLSSVVVL